MGNDVFVTRAERPPDGAQVPITEADWRDLIDRDPDLTAPDEAYPSYALWAGPSAMSAPWIDWADGNLFSRNPDQALLRKLVELADALGATVRGPGGEAFRESEGRLIRETPIRSEPEEDDEESAADLLIPTIANIVGQEPESIAEESHPPKGLSSEVLFGPRPQNAEAELELAAEGFELHAEAAFGPGAESTADHERAPLRPVADVPFSVGDRVRTSWGRPATVVSIDTAADEGLGIIEIRYDDGRMATMTCMAHGLVPL